MKLTTANVARLTLPDGKSDHIEFDDDVVGWGLRLRSSGKPTWIFQYRVGPRSRRMTLGTLAALSPSVARETAVKLYSKVKLGGDPAAEKAKAPTATGETFQAAVDIYLRRKADHWKPRSLTEATRQLTTYAKPLHRLPLAEVDRRAISKLLSHLAETSGDVTANRTGSTIAAMYGWCIREGWVDANPAATLNKRTETPRSRVLTDDELRAIWKATGGTDQHGAIVRLLLLTGARRDEIGGLTWDEIDLDRAQITLPPERTKNKREHIVPLSPLALSIVEAQPRTDRAHVFGDGPTHGYQGYAQGKATLDARTKIEPRWTLHDLRRTFSTRLNGEPGVAPHVVEACLGHHQGGVASIYNKASYQNEMRQALALWSEHLLAVVENRVPKVVSLRA